MELCLVVLIVCIGNALCFLLGTMNKDGVKIANPVEKVKEHKENKELSREQKQKQESIKTMLHNIDVYDGTDMGQKDI